MSTGTRPVNVTGTDSSLIFFMREGYVFSFGLYELGVKFSGCVNPHALGSHHQYHMASALPLQYK